MKKKNQKPVIKATRPRNHFVDIELVGGLFRLTSDPIGYQIEDRRAKQTYLVQVRKGRFIEQCSCGSPETDSFNSCQHQTLVRQFLFNRWFKKVKPWKSKQKAD